MSNTRMEYVSQLISLYELISLGLFLLAICTQSPFLAILGVAAVSKQLPEKLMKRLVPFPKYIRDRPRAAMNCNVLNKGGSYAEKPGFPSGHTTTAWFLFIYMYVQLQRYAKSGAWNATCVTGFYALFVPVSRILLHCHTPEQIYGGILLGSIWAILFDWVEQKYLMSFEWYKRDKSRVFQTMSSEMWKTFQQKHPNVDQWLVLLLVLATVIGSETAWKFG